RYLIYQPDIVWLQNLLDLIPFRLLAYGATALMAATFLLWRRRFVRTLGTMASALGLSGVGTAMVAQTYLVVRNGSINIFRRPTTLYGAFRSGSGLPDYL
ncbi:MAG TPA: hypothetical protein P5300_10845, partial [Acidobacteriota bacterium]|nr:hypothetical protein [Acidobacteriota bacterium]